MIGAVLGLLSYIMGRLSRKNSGYYREKDAFGTGTPSLTTVTSSASANTFGSYAEIESSIGQDSYISSISICTGNYTTKTVCIELATGAAASEVPFYRKSFSMDRTGSDDTIISFETILPRTYKIASGTRLAARITDSQASAVGYDVGIQYETDS